LSPISDAARLLKQVAKKVNLQRAFRYAHYDRQKEWFYDPFELEWAERNELTIIAELADELKDPLKYQLKPAFAYFTPKTELCYRRMIYIPFKDLVVRYALASVVADLVDQDLSPRCFANRREHDVDSGLFLQDFATVSWPSFCKWQRDNSEEGRFATLLRTDISAFYDAISHKYLVDEIANSLSIRADAKLMKLFRRLLRIAVVSYSHVDGNQRDPEMMHQGLCIGNATEGFFANLYLRKADREMGEIQDVEFGRYNDDMRIFAKDRLTATRARLALQERLLTKGLNLNSSKTEFAEGQRAIEDLRSRAYEGEEYGGDDEDTLVARPLVSDMPFDEFAEDFEVGQKLEKKGKDAKNFCHFLAKRIALSERQPGHVEMLRDILTYWHGSTKHAAWRLVESFARSECPTTTRKRAEAAILECLHDPNVTNYAKYRLVHHLIRPRRSRERYWKDLQDTTFRNLKKMLPAFLGEKAFELNIIALYAMRCLGASATELRDAVQQQVPTPVPLPIKNALSLATEPTAKKPKQLPAFAPIGDEEGEREDYY
jgi:Reverse transcriptase (RNA-dependent DNA polymerase)